MGACASNTMGNSKSRKNKQNRDSNGSTQLPKKKKFKSAVSKYGPYVETIDAEGNKIWSAPKNEEWPTFNRYFTKF